MWSTFKLFVYVAAGRICAAYPVTQTVLLIVACVTSGFVAPGVQRRSGRPFALVQELGDGIEMDGDGRIAAAIVGVGVDFDGVAGIAAAPPQLMAKTATTIRRAARNRGPGPTKVPPFPRLSLLAPRPN